MKNLNHKLTGIWLSHIKDLKTMIRLRVNSYWHIQPFKECKLLKTEMINLFYELREIPTTKELIKKYLQVQPDDIDMQDMLDELNSEE